MSCVDTQYAVCNEYDNIPEEGEWYGNIEDAMSDGEGGNFTEPVIWEITKRKVRVGVPKIEWERA